MRFTSTKKYVTGIILFAANIFLLITPVFSYESAEEEAGPVIAGVVINSCIGSITISVTSGTAPYTYAWEDSGGNSVGTNSFIVSGLGPDNYTVTVTDDNGDSVTATYTVTNPPDLVGSVVVNNVTCRGDSDAQVVITMSNGNPDYTWELFNSGGSSVQTGTEAFPSNIITIGGLGVDSYTLEVEDDDGCTGTITFNIIEPALFLGANLIDSQDATCSNSTDGRLEVVGTGGWGGYTYAWFNSSSAFLGNGSTLTGLMPGDYNVVITDSNGCQVSPTYTIDGPAPITNSSSLSHVTCESGTDGSIDINPGGGNGTFSYLWNTGATSQDLTGLTAGSYSVTITDIQGCTFTENFTITEPAILLINESVTDVSCHGGNDGSISSNVSGGTSPYTYLWSTGATSANLTSLAAGNFDLTVTDANGCQTMESFTVAEPASPLSVDSFTPTLPTCFGGSDGTLQVNVSGGTGPYTYLWSSGATSAMATGLSSGAQAVTITDAKGCVTIGNFTLNDPVAISVATVIGIPSCNGGADGSITASASNGAGPYTYNWNTGDLGPNINGLTAGSYQLTVTDAGGCSVIENVIVGEPDPIVSNAAVNDISCNGLTDGNIALAVTGGTGPYTYLWSTGATSSSISGLSAGPYDVTITDDNGCTAIDNFVIVDPAPIGSSLSQTNVLCRGNATGAINLTPSGGTLPYTYLWSNGATTQDISSLVAGTYTVTITDASLCSTMASTTITQPATALQVSGVATDASCNGSTNGAIDLTITGGIAPYTVLWNTGITTEDITALASGNYSVQVTDANGCVSSTSFTIDEPTPLIATPTVSDISCNGVNDGTINVAVSGGTGPYTYSWADGPTTKDRSGLSPGNYTLTTTDANGCQNVQPLVINEPAVLTTSVAQQNVNCFGESTGIINLSVSGGTAPYSYAWADGPTIEDRTALTAGNYNVIVTDARGCTSTEMITITEPASGLTFTNTVQQISCNGAADGIINLTVSGGTAPYSYNWSNGSSSEDLSGLPAAAYNVTITDALGCTTTGSFTITDPPVLVVSGSETDITCFGAADGSIDLTVSGGEAPYTYMWAHGPTSQDVSGLGPGAYSVQIVDNRGCSQLTSFTIAEPLVLNLSYTKSDIACFGGNDGSIDLTVSGGTGPYNYAWDHGSAAEDLNSLLTGSYTVTVTDANGCSAMETVMIDQPSAALFKAETITNVTCNGFSNGIIDVVVSGGALPYSYSWNDGFTTQDRLGLSPGTYALTITDANGCQLIDSYTITQPDALSSSTSIDQVSCFGIADGEIDLTVSGGTGAYSYLWSDGAITEDRDNLSPGNYSVTVTDNNGCQVTESVTITEPAAISITEVVTDIACFGNASGAIDITVNGGTAPYVYSWSDGSISEDLTGLTAGTFSVTITDANNCMFNKDIVVSQPAQPLAINEVVNDISCFGANDGIIQLNVTGGTAPYTFAWDHGATTEDITALLTGNYNVLVTDANGCSTSGNFTIDSPAALQVSSVVEDLTCNGAGDGNIDLTITGGSAPYTYAWSNGATTEDLSGVAADNYMVTITDANGCSLNRSFTVTEPLILEVSGAVTNVLCFGEGDGAIDVNTTGGTAPYVYSWSNGAVTEDLFNINGGSYTLTVTDANGCQSIESFTVTEPVSSLSIAGTIIDVSCFGANNGTITTTISGGTAPYVYSWNQGAITQNLSGQAPGGYQLTVTDANGCSVSESFTIQGPAILQVSKSISNLSCFEANDGAIDLTITGGAGPYLFAWTHGPTSEDLSGLSAGTYQVQITDANGCSISETVDIQQPATLSLAHNTTDVNCFAGNDGRIDLTVSGGTFPFTYNWSNGTTTEDLSTLQAGSYAVTVTDAQGCSISQTIAITEPTAALSATATISDVTCSGADDGSIDLNLSGGTLPYTYQWNTGATTEDISGLLPGTYQVTVTDNNGCEIIRDYTISTPQPLAITGAVTDISCRGAGDGAIGITASGGTAPYSYSWSTGATTQNISGLDIGGYSVLVTDANGCTTSSVYTITQPLDLVINNIVTDVSCFGADDGSIDLTITGGTAPYSYDWSNGETTQDIQNLTGGAQTVRVLDARGCQVTAVISVGAPSAPLAADAVISDVACNGATSGRIDLTMTGGTGPYSYAWSNGSSQPNLLNVFAGSYEVIVTDAKGCIFTNTYEISEPDAISVTFDIANTSCFGDNDGGITISPVGGTGPYSYVWSNGSTSKNQVNLGGGTYNVTITDANNCSIVRSVTVGDASDLTVKVNKVDVLCKGETSGAIDLTVTGGSGIYSYQWGDGETTQNLNELPAGIYQVLVSDGSGCATTASVVISEPAASLDIQVDKSPDFTCFGQNDGFARVTPLGGVAPYAYLWSNGARTAEITDIPAGDYTVNVTDANGCSIQQAFRISQPDQPISLVATGNLDLACLGNTDGNIHIDVTGGTAPYTYLWSTGSNENELNNLIAGDYTLRVVDALGCTIEQTFTVRQPDELRIVNAFVNESQCFDDRNGAIELEIEGGTGPYQYQWSNGATTKNIIGISSGEYSVVVTDDRGCAVQAAYQLADPALFRLNPEVSVISCIGENDASISLNIEGGVGDLIIRWNTGQVGETLSNLGPGIYNVTVSDENECSLQQTFNIIEPLPVTLDAFVQDAIECGNPSSGQINLIVSGGRAPYTYRWSNGATNQRLTELFPGTYAVTVTDAFGCSATGTYSVQQPDPLKIGLRTQILVNCDTRTVDNQVSAEVSGGFGGYQYEWSRGSGNGSEITVSEPGRLTLMITDDNGCTLEKSIDISIPELGEADFDFTSESIVRDGEPTANDPVSFFDGSFGDIIDWAWDFGDGFDSREVDPIHTYSAPGIYTVTLVITDGSGCTSLKIETIEITEGYRVMVPDAFTPNGDGNNDFFRPRLLGLEKVQLMVFNTWGEVIFNTEDVQTPGWDGTIRGKPAENGNYVYKLVGRSFNGLAVERDGVFALIK